MTKKRLFKEADLARLAKGWRQAAGKSKADVARELGVAAPTVFCAEEQPEMSLTKLRVRMVEAYSPFKVIGPVFMLKRPRRQKSV
jgi:hypothetical protein